MFIDFLNFDTDKTKSAANSFEKDFFKLMNNSVYSKIMQIERKGINVRLLNKAGDYKKCVSNPSFVLQKIFNKNLFAIHEIKPVLILDKPIYFEFSILDLSKLLIHEFHCKCIKRTFSANLLFTDTDSLIFQIETDYIYDYFYEDKNLFDFND